MSKNKKIWYGDRYPKSVLEDIQTPPTIPPMDPDDVFTFDRMDITFDSMIRTFDEI